MGIIFYFMAIAKTRKNFIGQPRVQDLVQFHQYVEILLCRYELRVEQFALSAFDVADHPHPAARHGGQFFPAAV